MSFLNFQHTCPTIDQVIRDLDGLLNDALEEAIDEANCHIDPTIRRTILHSTHNIYFDRIKDEIETLRNLNADMRSQAEDQLESLASEILDLTGDIERLEAQVDELETEVTLLRDNEAF